MFDFAMKFIEIIVVTVGSLFAGAIKGVPSLIVTIIYTGPGVTMLALVFLVLCIAGGFQLFPYLIENGRKLEEKGA